MGDALHEEETHDRNGRRVTRGRDALHEEEPGDLNKRRVARRRDM
jgi:hypothetical protein